MTAIVVPLPVSAAVENERQKAQARADLERLSQLILELQLDIIRGANAYNRDSKHTRMHTFFSRFHHSRADIS